MASSSWERSTLPRYFHSTARWKYFAASRPCAAMLTSPPIVSLADAKPQPHRQHSLNLSWAATTAWPISNNHYTNWLLDHAFHLIISATSHYTRQCFTAAYPILSYDMINSTWCSLLDCFQNIGTMVPTGYRGSLGYQFQLPRCRWCNSVRASGIVIGL